jgi:hypothetical protein
VEVEGGVGLSPLAQLVSFGERWRRKRERKTHLGRLVLPIVAIPIFHRRRRWELNLHLSKEGPESGSLASGEGEEGEGSAGGLFCSSESVSMEKEEKQRKKEWKEGRESEDARMIAALTISAKTSLLPWSKYPRTGHDPKSLYANSPQTSILSFSQPSRSFPGGSLRTFSRRAWDWAMAILRREEPPREEVEADMPASDPLSSPPPARCGRGVCPFATDEVGVEGAETAEEACAVRMCSMKPWVWRFRERMSGARESAQGPKVEPVIGM